MSASLVLRLAAFVLFLFATLGAFDWGVHWTLGTVIGLLAAGLACWVAASFPLDVPRAKP